MPKEGVFAKVIRGGLVKAGGQIRIKNMDNEVEKIPVLRFAEEGVRNFEDVADRELPWRYCIRWLKSIAIIISVSAPTHLGVRITDDLVVTLVGFVRRKSMNVCTNRYRVTTDGDRNRVDATPL